MKKLSTILLYILSIAVLSWFLPWLYALLTPTPSAEPFCAFSPVNGQWIISRSAPGEKPQITVASPFSNDPLNENDIRLTVAMRDSLVPQLYYRQLIAHDLLPDSIAGKETSVHNLRTKEVFFNNSPREINKHTPGVWLMMESMPVRVDLSDPEETFRFTADGIEFIRMADNTVNTDRSCRFTEAMKSRGFTFPAIDLSANISSKKAYDEGYLMTDYDGKLYHVKQQAGRPYVAQFSLPDSVKISKAIIWEESDRSLLGMAVDTDGHPYLLKTDGHLAVRLPAGSIKVNPRSQTLMAMGNLFNITLRLSDSDGTQWLTFDADDLSLAGSLYFPRQKSAAATAARYIFPYTLSFVSVYDSLAYPRISNLSWLALPLNILLAVILMAIGIRRKNCGLKAGAAVTVIFGIYSFIPFILLHD